MLTKRQDEETEAADLHFLTKPQATFPNDPNEPAKGHRRRPPWIAMGLGVVGLVLAFAAGNYFAQPGASEENAAAAQEAPLASQPPDTVSGISLSARVIAKRRTTVSSTYTAILDKVFVKEGDMVVAGQPLAEMDILEARASMAAASARLRQAGASVDNVAAEVEVTRLRLERAMELSPRGFVSRAELDERTADYTSAQARMNQATSAREAARADLQSASVTVDRAIIRAPFSGVVSAVSAQPGEVVSPVSAGGGFVRTGICTLIDLDSRQLEAWLPERYLDEVFVGQTAEFTSDALAGDKVMGTISSIGSELDAQRGAVLVTLDLGQLDPRLLPNMSGTIRITGEASR